MVLQWINNAIVNNFKGSNMPGPITFIKRVKTYPIKL